ncbi:MAG TPA: 2Fe-2S iron-sulfur cluster-binding protein [Pseudomonas sp.]|nr:2Fe-2S iron-sulfur cluster-binding protein [Pseudomonas sp.]
MAFQRLRVFHWLLAGLFGAAYLSGDDGELLHVWLGYGLLAVLLVRPLLGLLRVRGFAALLPSRAQRRGDRVALAGKLLSLAMLASFVVTGLLGLGLVDNGEVLGNAVRPFYPAAPANLLGAAAPFDFSAWIDQEEVHEFFANLSLWLVGLHVLWLLLFRRRLAWSMLRGASAAAVPSVAPAAAQPLTVSAVQAETAEASTFEFAVPEHLRAQFAARPGQFLTLRVPCQEPALWRCYSLSAPAEQGARLRVTVKRVAGGRASNWLLDHLEAGMTLDVRPPAGRFTPASLDADLLLVGAGSGITPLYAIAQAALAQGSGRVCLFYANRDRAAAIFRRELEALARAWPQRLTLLNWYDDADGRLDAASLSEALAGWSHADCFVCGPGAFMDLAAAALQWLGVPAQRLHSERFAAEPPASAAEGIASRLEVHLGGREYRVEVKAGEALLDGMERAGLNPPSACRSGVCAACKCRVSAGSVALPDNPVLDERELAAGWTLACQARPTSAQVVVEY